MGSKIRVTFIIGIIFLFFLNPFSFSGNVNADEAEEEDFGMQDIALFLHEDVANASLNTSYGFGREDYHVLTTTITDTIAPNVIEIGEWITEPITYPMNIGGQIYFRLYAMGNLEQVRFFAQLTVNGVDVGPEMSTAIWDLNETYPVDFVSDIENLTEPSEPLELNYTDTIGLRISLQHTDLQYYTPPPLGSGGKNVTLVFSYGHGSYVAFYANSMKVIDMVGRDDSGTGNIIVTGTIKCSFGIEDFDYAKAESDYGKLTMIDEPNIIDDGTLEVEWEWDHTVTQGGSYPVTVKARDRSYNYWELTGEIHITTPNTEIDFSISGSDISLSSDPEKDKETTIKAKITGSGKRWSSYYVDIEFYDGSTLLETVTAKITLGGTNEVTVAWTPEAGGTHTIKVVIDPDDEIQELVENNNEATKNVKVSEGGSTEESPGFEVIILLAALAIALFAGRRSSRNK
jgi:hypothetical protein